MVCPFTCFLCVAFAALPLLWLLLWIVTPIRVAKQHLKDPMHPQEESYENAENRCKKTKFASILDEPSLYLSLVVPAYNEEDRIEIMLHDTVKYLEKRGKEDKSFTYEIIVVDDGSSDRTVDKVMSLAKQYPNSRIRVMRLHENHGKGGAIRKGILRASGKYILMLDADGATNIEDIVKLEEVLIATQKAGMGVVVGSRAHLEDEAIATRSPLRNLLMHGFHFIVSTLCVKKVRDTQCGFKLFTRKSAQLIFSALHVERWAFDVEVLYICELEKIPIEEVAVRWHEIPGSKLTVATATLTMLRELVLIRLCYVFGLWSLNDGKHWLNALSKK